MRVLSCQGSLLHSSPRSKKTHDRQVVLDKWFPLSYRSNSRARRHRTPRLFRTRIGVHEIIVGPDQFDEGPNRTPPTSDRIAPHRIASHRFTSRRMASHRIASHRIASLEFASHILHMIWGFDYNVRGTQKLDFEA